MGRNKLRMSFDIQSVPTNQNLEIDSTIDFFFLIKHLLLVTELDRENRDTRFFNIIDASIKLIEFLRQKPRRNV